MKVLSLCLSLLVFDNALAAQIAENDRLRHENAQFGSNAVDTTSSANDALTETGGFAGLVHRAGSAYRGWNGLEPSATVPSPTPTESSSTALALAPTNNNRISYRRPTTAEVQHAQRHAQRVSYDSQQDLVDTTADLLEESFVQSAGSSGLAEGLQYVSVSNQGDVLPDPQEQGDYVYFRDGPFEGDLQQAVGQGGEGGDGNLLVQTGGGGGGGGGGDGSGGRGNPHRMSSQHQSQRLANARLTLDWAAGNELRVAPNPLDQFQDIFGVPYNDFAGAGNELRVAPNPLDQFQDIFGVPYNDFAGAGNELRVAQRDGPSGIDADQELALSVYLQQAGPVDAVDTSGLVETAADEESAGFVSGCGRCMLRSVVAQSGIREIEYNGEVYILPDNVNVRTDQSLETRLFLSALGHHSAEVADSRGLVGPGLREWHERYMADDLMGDVLPPHLYAEQPVLEGFALHHGLQVDVLQASRSADVPSYLETVNEGAPGGIIQVTNHVDGNNRPVHIDLALQRLDAPVQASNSLLQDHAPEEGQLKSPPEELGVASPSDDIQVQWRHPNPPAGLSSWNRSSAGLPIDWREGNYHPGLKHVQEGIELHKSKMAEAGITHYNKSTLKDGTVEVVHWQYPHLPWDLAPDYNGPVGAIIYNYVSLQSARGHCTRGESCFEARRSDGQLTESTFRLVEMGLPPGTYQSLIKADWHPYGWKAYAKGGCLSVFDEEIADFVNSSYRDLVLDRIAAIESVEIMLGGDAPAKEYRKHFHPDQFYTSFKAEVEGGKHEKVHVIQVHSSAVYNPDFASGMKQKLQRLDAGFTSFGRCISGDESFVCTIGQGRYEENAALFELAEEHAREGSRLGGKIAGAISSKLKSDGLFHYSLCLVDGMDSEEALGSVEEVLGRNYCGQVLGYLNGIGAQNDIKKATIARLKAGEAPSNDVERAIDRGWNHDNGLQAQIDVRKATIAKLKAGEAPSNDVERAIDRGWNGANGLGTRNSEYQAAKAQFDAGEDLSDKSTKILEDKSAASVKTNETRRKNKIAAGTHTRTGDAWYCSDCGNERTDIAVKNSGKRPYDFWCNESDCKCKRLFLPHHPDYHMRSGTNVELNGSRLSITDRGFTWYCKNAGHPNQVKAGYRGKSIAKDQPYDAYWCKQCFSSRTDLPDKPRELSLSEQSKKTEKAQSKKTAGKKRKASEPAMPTKKPVKKPTKKPAKKKP